MDINISSSVWSYDSAIYYGFKSHSHSIHMDVYIPYASIYFLAGFFAKGAGDFKFIGKLAKKLIIPYIIFQVLYTVYYFFLGKSDWYTDTIFYPHWSLWFLFSLFCWHLLLILYKK